MMVLMKSDLEKAQQLLRTSMSCSRPCSRPSWGRIPWHSRSLLWLPMIWMISCHTTPRRFVSAFAVLHQRGLSTWTRSTRVDKPFLPTTALNTLTFRNHFPITTSASSTTTTTSCHLFFRKSQDEAKTQKGRKTGIDPLILCELESATCTLPYAIPAPDITDNSNQEKLTVRFMTRNDLPTILALCIDEFGYGTTMTIFDFPWSDRSEVPDWWDRVTFEPTITLSLLSKMNANLNYDPRKSTAIHDPAILVLSRKSNSNMKNDNDETKEQVVGMVEISLQPPNPNRNPPSFPIPRWIKELLVKSSFSNSRLQGWVTNLLIDPKCRGLGYSKILMAATEGIARRWDCEYIYLHADADYRSGRVAQTLYQGLGYRVVTDTNPDYAWMTNEKGSETPFSSIRIVEGAPLLCFRKTLLPETTWKQ